jgi:ABC-type polysaccharide/polyol phosphate transport system ATPase subunit
VGQDVVIVENLSRKYALYGRPVDRLKELILRRPYHHDFLALEGVSFRVPRGQTLGIVGENGAGKSTLLQILAGVLQPTAGRVEVHGRVAALLELGAGFNPEFTGRENVLLNGAIMGVPEAEMRERLEAIAAFAGIGEFLDQPVKTYSSGMYVRLAFATAIHVDPDVLLADETLAVGDAYFQHRCMLRMAELQARGVTIILVTHDVAAVKRLCQRALWLAHGRVVDDGPPERVVARYLASLFGQPEQEPANGTGASPATGEGAVVAAGMDADAELAPPHVDRRFGNGDAEIVGVGIFDEQGRPVTSVVHGRPFEVRVRVRFHRPVARPMIGFVFRDRLGTDLASTNTTLEGYRLPAAEAGEVYTVRFACEPPLLHPGHYAFAVTAADGDLAEYTMNDWIDNAMSLEIVGEAPIYTVFRFPIRCSFQRTAVAAAPTGATAGPRLGDG